MLRRQSRKIVLALSTMLVLASISVSLAHASATLLLEEPYGKLGFFTATGHAAVYLSGVCAETPLKLRPCAPGELGIVLSRYDGVGGYDWVAIPLIPYLYAVERPEDVPLFANAKMTAFLRDQYRRKYLEAVVPDLEDGSTPGGNWYELVGSAYDRTLYGFEIATTAEQDAALIRHYNSMPNQSHFHTVSRNCADFAKDVMNFYHPRALHRSVIADVGITTPKQMAKMLVKFSKRHPELQLTRFVIPQVPGSAARSTAVHGVVESFLKSKKYYVPSVVVSPIFAGCVAAVYVGTGAGHFDPAHDALVFSPQRVLEPPLQAEDRRSYQSELKHLETQIPSVARGKRADKAWGRLLGNAVPKLDAEGRPLVQIRTGEQLVSVGVSPDNVLANSASPQLTEQLLEARLEEELRHGVPPKASESDVERDWRLLQEAINGNREPVVAETSGRMPEPETSPLGAFRAGNQP
ncbi:MAG: hypothetical protein WCA16_12335 [Candidatus Sulfotelmatobacter sp.]